MVLDYFKLREHPFGVTPDSRYLFMSPTHREALASLLYGVDAGCGFLALIASPGLGKTTLLFHTMNQLRQKALAVFLFQTVCTPLDLLHGLLHAIGVEETQGSLSQKQSRLKEVLVEQARLGKRVVVVIDEAQNLDDSVLELIRMLSNFETDREKLLQIILSGQPQLADKIGSPELDQLRQRVSIFASLKPFSHEDTQLYIEHRLRVAGYNFETPMFTREALARIADCSKGIPRNINNLCFNSLALASALQRKPIDIEIVRDVVDDLDVGRFRKSTPTRSEERASQTAPSFLYAQESPFAGWAAKSVLALVALLAVGGAIFARWSPAHKPLVHLKEAPKAAPSPNLKRDSDDAKSAAVSGTAGQAESSVSPLLILNSSSAGAGQEGQAVAPEGTVSVTPGKTLIGICVENFGKCNPALLQQIRELNPRLNNLDHIESGELIRLPVSITNAEQPAQTSIAQKEMQ